ncbi:MAG: peptidylprolyl isomerase [Rhizobiaceae bacterium]|nr:MAG: peptidylprolyl isomerase [Rhizobiaceae bacterium]
MTVTINGVEIAVGPDEPAELAAARELLRQRAVEAGFLDGKATDADAAGEAIEALLAREVVTPTPEEAECRRYYDGHPREFISGDLVHARHILFQVTPAVPVPEIRARAEQTLNTLLREPDRFEALAQELSNCPSGQQGGNLGQIGRGDMVPEFEQALFRPGPKGMLRDVVKTRFGFHVVSVDRRIAGEKLPFDAVREQIAARLSATVEEKAMRQYVSVLAARAELVGVDLDAAVTPLVQ